ncbi:MAG: hypothetical protein KQA33_02265 [Candidatus Aenigmarchaeota archaeon]|nr:hypothetical protein [Candidatus Aenigmarchaeota archaeon]
MVGCWKDAQVLVGLACLCLCQPCVAAISYYLPASECDNYLSKANNCLGMAKKPFGGIVIRPDAKLAAIVGKKDLPPSKMTKAIWTYIKKHKLLKR